MSDAKSYERIGRRIHIEESEETKKLLLDDTYNNLETALEKDGTTGFLSNPDGIIRGKIQAYKGFIVQCFGTKFYSSDIDVFGSLRWYGFAKREVFIKGKMQKIMFDIQSVRQAGFDTEYEAGNHLFRTIDAFQENFKN